MRIEEFDYFLPPELVAQYPAPRRDEARLMVVRRASGEIAHQRVHDLPTLLQPPDCLVVNNTAVIPARLVGRRSRTGGKWEGLFLRETSDGQWEMLAQTRGILREGETLEVVSPGDGEGDEPTSAVRRSREASPRGATQCTREASAVGVLDPARPAPLREPPAPCALQLVFEGRTDSGHWLVRPPSSGTPLDLLAGVGRVPLPPYIRKGRAEPDDAERYQTIYATQPGAVAAPTAGLHFSRALIDRLTDAGLAFAEVTLHVGPGTFQPITAERVERHKLHAEWGSISESSAARIRARRQQGGRVVAVGTTSCRLLETVARGGPLRAWAGETGLYIYPPFEFRAVDALLTNFHLPRSSLLVLVSAFAGQDLIRRAYAEAVREKYRFYSYGDAMLIL